MTCVTAGARQQGDVSASVEALALRVAQGRSDALSKMLTKGEKGLF